MADEGQQQEEDLRQSLQNLELYKNQLQQMYQQLEFVKASMDEHERAAETLTRYKDTKDGEELLVPIGGDSFIFATVTKPGKALVGVGSGVKVEEDIASGLERVEKRLDQLRSNQTQLMSNIQELETYAGAIQEKLNRLYSQQLGGQFEQPGL